RNLREKGVGRIDRQATINVRLALITGRKEGRVRASSGYCSHSPNGIYGISGSEGSASFRLDIGGLYFLVPFLGFVGDQLAELGRRPRQRRAAEVSETGLHLRVVESRVDLLVELVDDLGRRGSWYAEAVPITLLVARQELTHGRDVRQRLRAF